MTDFNALSPADQETFRTISAKLLNECFLINRKDSPTARDEFNFLKENQEMFRELFDKFGYKLMVDTSRAFAGIYRGDNVGRLHLKKSESIVLLTLRMMYVEKMQAGLIQTQFPTVHIGEIKKRFESLLINTIGQQSLKEALALCARYKLIDKTNCDMTDDSFVIVYPSITLTVSNDGLSEIYQAAEERMETYSNIKEENNEIENIA